VSLIVTNSAISCLESLVWNQLLCVEWELKLNVVSCNCLAYMMTPYVIVMVSEFVEDVTVN